MRKLFLLPVKWYKKCVSPYKGFSCCKYYPSCSQYAEEAIKRFGAVKGTALAAYRLLRCNPFSKGGYDPVPEKSERGAKKIAYPQK